MKEKRYKYLWKKAQNEDIIRRAWKNLRKNKTKRKSVLNIDANLDSEIKAMKQMIRDTVPENPEKGYQPPKIRKTKIVHEHGKRRTAHLADIREQWYFHIIVEVLKPIVIRRLSENSCGCIPGRGAHSGKRNLQKLIRKDKVRYVFKGDVRHFYDNIRIDVVIRELRKDIADERFLYLIRKIYLYRNKGILIGLYISPWLANYVLITVDKIIEETPGVHLVRYVDDIVAVSTNKRTLQKLIPQIIRELGHLRLKLKRTYQVFKFDYITRNKDRIGRPIDFMGFVFFKEKTIIREQIMLSATRTARRLKKAKERGRRFYAKAVRGLVSKMGWFKYTNSHDCYLLYIKPYVNIGKLKKIISKLDKEERRNDRMEKGNLCGTTA